MKKQVAEAVLRETTRCPHDFSCLSSGKCGEHAMCRVRYADGGNILFLHSKDRISCPYRMGFGFGQICTCPVHYHLYKQENG